MHFTAHIHPSDTIQMLPWVRHYPTDTHIQYHHTINTGAADLAPVIRGRPTAV